ncbi:hypothetical protein CEY16_01435 [Halalkalibacillus sediminis]|uniref:Uncharacterized protein n=1 Tax=Halalkalibacillus sediminis TaxID=2018042 RepID=A0A2I0QVT0_9BACI|nr:hypothetical protein [Halalkalibacillus sediminis]PKR78447.1 hypothetical protein CEY16_01435 [Halalkalibacillus sediminis]
MSDDFKRKDVEVQHHEKKTDNSRVGATAIKWIAILIIVFAIMWFIISYIFPMFGGGSGNNALSTLDVVTNSIQGFL